MKSPVVNCPSCNAVVSWTAENRWKPFCSERCKLIDLGQWAAEKYRMPAEKQDQEPEEAPPLAQ